ncbi:hypothetical protein BDD12DRAFT_802782 [Trichophaea hybrida]|nr:hypothetical protein BDD12DRAFT_802782 [Trichophaea hybrida]
MRWNALNLAGAIVFGAAVFPVAFASPAPGRNLGGIDIDSIQNKVRSGAIAVANSEQPFDERNKKSTYRNGDLVDTFIIEVPENNLQRRQLAFAPAATGRKLGGIDIDGIQNKVRSGAIAIANSEQPFDECNKKATYRNGDLVDTSIIEAPENELQRRQVVNNQPPNKSPGDCAREFPALAAAADNMNVTASYHCDGICPGLNFTRFDGDSCARVLGYFQVNPLASFVVPVPNNGSCVDSCAAAGYNHGVFSSTSDTCQCLSSFLLQIEVPEFQCDPTVTDETTCLLVYRVDFVCPRATTVASLEAPNAPAFREQNVVNHRNCYNYRNKNKNKNKNFYYNSDPFPNPYSHSYALDHHYFIYYHHCNCIDRHDFVHNDYGYPVSIHICLRR